MRPFALLLCTGLLACAAPDGAGSGGKDGGADTAKTALAEAQGYGALARSLTTQDDCEAAGGVWGRGGLNPEPFCNMRYPDAGKVCTDASECGGRCIAADEPDMATKAAGVCQTYTSQFGCYGLVENGTAGPTLCVD